MRYLKPKLSTVTDEEIKKGAVNGTIELLCALVTKSPLLTKFENQTRWFRITNIWHDFLSPYISQLKTETANKIAVFGDGAPESDLIASTAIEIEKTIPCLEINDDDYDFVLKMLKAVNYSQVVDGITLLLLVGDTLALFEDLPKTKPV